MPRILRTIARLANRHDPRPAGSRERPERIVLAARSGAAPSAKPPVRIFVGTEPEQYRAERVFLWSVERARDPSRVYEIFLMTDLVGFDRRRWLTGFTNYRFAIPHFAGGSGRAIYNDVDQIYLGDPAELFDMDMGAHGFLSITARDTSVMLIDCARMSAVWTLAAAQRLRRKRIEARTRARRDLWGALQPEWNARDEEYVAGRSKVLHYTTIHTQPWQPFPERFVYQHNPVAHVWLDLERAADAAHYQPFSAQHPSARYQALLGGRLAAGDARSHATGPPGAVVADGLEELLVEARATSVLEFLLAPLGGGAAPVAQRPGRTVTRFSAVESPLGALADKSFDAAVCVGALDSAPEEDVAWLIESLFRSARRCVYLSASATPALLSGAQGQRVRGRARPQSWWLERVERASRRFPEVHWKLVVHGGAAARRVREGGRRADGKPPVVWVLKDHKAGHTTQSVGLAEAIGFPYEIKALRFNLLNHLSNRIRGASTLGLNRAGSAPLAPPWPDLVIATGRRAAPVARWIGRQSCGRTRLVQLGRRGGETVDAFDLVVSCAHFRLPLHARRIEITAPLNAVTPERLARAVTRWWPRFDGAPHPRIVLVAGGTSSRYRLDATTARRMGAKVRAVAESVGGSVFAITSPRTGAAATDALRRGLGPSGHLHEWRPGEPENPYLGYLALADALVVTGESESMLAEAVAAGKPLFIYRLRERGLGFRWPAEWVARHAEARPRKAKGTVRPQQGLEYLCARLIAAGLVRPPRHLDQLHARLIAAGVARYFDMSFDANPHRGLRDMDDVAGRVRSLLGFSEPASPEPALRHLRPDIDAAGAQPLPDADADRAGVGHARRRAGAAGS